MYCRRKVSLKLGTFLSCGFVRPRRIHNKYDPIRKVLRILSLNIFFFNSISLFPRISVSLSERLRHDKKFRMHTQNWKQEREVYSGSTDRFEYYLCGRVNRSPLNWRWVQYSFRPRSISSHSKPRRPIEISQLIM